ncbi:putative Dnaj domain protein [Leptomonas pyrrhocoris]|uniref:Putative Dnaj domain protein n=1 Tax=Leptomonas pyrrhocoris TaxID=157538 RepID=A0A0M9FZK8_LEPPY|nr:putative Dnaj domain protein [Leptomonas pyrrhocoris]KPA79147.1 putative Dnaj domain protein [Leptomonas pyrrhocoris]|eukprot:XP_015657586.1 putative Dnaj domain protein [Leptomonas pyrrhocoris]
MFWCSRVLRYLVHSPRGVNFSLSADDAVSRIRDKYGRRWFGARLDYLDLEHPSKEFLPFYLCSGRIHATFVGNITYSTNQMSVDGKSTSSSTRRVSTALQTLESVFEENKTQIYAGYKYNIAHVHSALRSDEMSYTLQKMYKVDTAGATINLFEQSTSSMIKFVEMETRRQAEATAQSMVRSFHPDAQSITIAFKEFTFHIDEVTPTFVPCYVVKANYDEERYTLYVSGVNGQVGGPYLLNSLFLARTTALAVVAATLFVVPNKIAAFVYGSVISVAAYYAAFYTAKWYPAMRRNWNRHQRQKLRTENLGTDHGGYRPSTTSRHIQQEYRTSSYWDSHPFQQRKWKTAHAAGTDTGSARASSASSASSSSHPVADPLGYYRILELRGDESVNEIRSAYRRIVLKQHPDVGGSEEAMTKVNEAYRVLRDPKRRDAYDRQLA